MHRFDARARCENVLLLVNADTHHLPIFLSLFLFLPPFWGERSRSALLANSRDVTLRYQGEPPRCTPDLSPYSSWTWNARAFVPPSTRVPLAHGSFCIFDSIRLYRNTAIHHGCRVCLWWSTQGITGPCCLSTVVSYTHICSCVCVYLVYVCNLYIYRCVRPFISILLRFKIYWFIFIYTDFSTHIVMGTITNKCLFMCIIYVLV